MTQTRLEDFSTYCINRACKRRYEVTPYNIALSPRGMYAASCPVCGRARFIGKAADAPGWVREVLGLDNSVQKQQVLPQSSKVTPLPSRPAQGAHTTLRDLREQAMTLLVLDLLMKQARLAQSR